MSEEGGAEHQSGALSVVMSALNWAWDQAIATLRAKADGGPQSSTPDREAAEAAIENAIRWHVAYAGVAGFGTNLGGLVTLPVALPANLASVAWIQCRMIADIAQQRGYNPADDQVRTLAYLCLCGSAAFEVLEEVGVKLGVQLSTRLVMQISGALLTKINQAVGFRLLTKAGTTGVVNLTKIVPFLGGIVGGGVDAAVTWGVGEAAKALFPRRDSTDAAPGGMPPQSKPPPNDPGPIIRMGYAPWRPNPPVNPAQRTTPSSPPATLPGSTAVV